MTEALWGQSTRMSLRPPGHWSLQSIVAQWPDFPSARPTAGRSDGEPWARPCRTGEEGPLFGEFYGFVRALLAVTQNPLSCRPAGCRSIGNDEALALSMIGAAQVADTVGLLAAAAELLGVDELGDALRATQSLATALAKRGLFIRAPHRTARAAISVRSDGCIESADRELRASGSD